MRRRFYFVSLGDRQKWGMLLKTAMGEWLTYASVAALGRRLEATVRGNH